MKDWLIEIVDQIALGEFLAKSPVTCGQRFGLIAVDNAIEFMLITYIEIYKQLIGAHKPSGIAKRDWDDTKRQFPKLLPFVIAIEPSLQPLEIEITRYHEFRNNLYHTGLPVTTPADRIIKYAKLAKEVLAILFDITFSSNEWDETLSRIGVALSGENAENTIKRQVTYEETEGVVKFSTAGFPRATEAIALCLHGYSVITGASPSRLLLSKSLAMSGHPLTKEVVNARFADLRKSGWLQKTDLVLSAKGRKELAKKYLI